ncbi:hypothetical protein IM511_09340 [Erythrobacteraceae bacterium E2-1 Yellow Sea]|nr:hypothetical protein [Erythrobacteraceae bacterium E2-1 Yellow Sea]
MPADLLITVAVDLGGGNGFADSIPAIVNEMQRGKAGGLRHGNVTGGWLAARANGWLSDGATPEIEVLSPVQDHDGGYTLLAGWIHDRGELNLQFGADPALSDQDFYAAIHARFGENCDRLIHGNYVAIRWFPERHLLRLARSVACRPLHVWRQGSRVIASSIPRALFAAGLEPKPDHAKLGDALLLNYSDGSRSWYVGAERLEAGTVQWHDPAGERHRRFWSVHDVPDVRFARDDDYVEAVDAAFRKGTAAELIGVARPAISLSGGFDSQAVASYLVELIGPNQALISYTSVPQAGWQAGQHDTSFGDESAKVRALAEMYPQLQPRFITGADRRFCQDQDAMLAMGSWPARNEVNMHWIREMFSCAVAEGCDAVFHGAAGNTGFSYDGLTGYPTWFAEGRWQHLWLENARNRDHRPAWRRLISRAVMPHVSLGLRRLIDAPRRWRPSPFETWCPMRWEFARDSGVFDRARKTGFDPYFYDVPTSRDWRAAVLGEMLSEGGEIELALQLQHGIGYRDPTSYRPLLELCIGIPDDQYLRDGTQRWLGRRLLQGRVPEAVWGERRAGRQAADWAMRFQRDHEILDDELAQMQRDPALTEVFDVARLSSDWAAWQGGEDPEKHEYERICAALGRAVSTARFLRYVGGNGDSR